MPAATPLLVVVRVLALVVAASPWAEIPWLGPDLALGGRARWPFCGCPCGCCRSCCGTFFGGDVSCYGVEASDGEDIHLERRRDSMAQSVKLVPDSDSGLYPSRGT